MAHASISRRRALQTLGAAAVAAPWSVLAQGRCARTPDTPACTAAPIAPVFAPTGWRTTSLEHVTFGTTDYRKEAAFYIALMGWTLRSDDGRQAVLDIGDWGSVVFAPAVSGARTGVISLCFGIEPWSADNVEAALRARGLSPVAAHDDRGFESFRVKDPDGLDLQISNSAFAVARRKTPAAATLAAKRPFVPTGWKTVWLDHISYGVANYKASASFYRNLLGWQTTYDEGSQEECLIGDVGDIIIRGGNPLAPGFAPRGSRATGVDHISFGITPWSADAVKAALTARGLRAQVDTGGGADIHTSPYQSFHTTTPGGYNLQISNITRRTRLTLSNAVRPRKP